MPNTLRAATFILLAAWPMVASAQGEGTTRPYMVMIVSDLQVKTQDQPKAQDLHATTALDYALRDQGSTREITIQAVAVLARIDGRALSDSKMDHQGITIKVGEQETSTLSRDEAPDPLKAVLDDFGRPAFSYKLDAEGAPTEENLLIKADSSLVENGLIALARLFHVRFPKAEDRWEVPAEVSLSSGQYARGTLTYEKAGADAEGRVTVKVSGTLKAEGQLGAGQIRGGVYEVSGTQIYDPTVQDWLSGNLTFDVKFDIATPGEPPASANGTMKVTLQPAKANAPAQPAEAPAPSE